MHYIYGKTHCKDELAADKLVGRRCCKHNLQMIAIYKLHNKPVNQFMLAPSSAYDQSEVSEVSEFSGLSKSAVIETLYH